MSGSATAAAAAAGGSATAAAAGGGSATAAAAGGSATSAAAGGSATAAAAAAAGCSLHPGHNTIIFITVLKVCNKFIENIPQCQPAL